MTKIDEALKLSAQDPKAQPLFYDLFLNSVFFIPTLEDEQTEKEAGALPLLVEANDKTYLMLFDTIKRLTNWADEKTKYVPLAGHMIVEMSIPKIYWALNYGTEYQKFFETEEIDWLKDIVRQSKEDMPGQSSS